MFGYQLLKNHAGVMLIADYLQWRELHDVLHDVHTRSPLIKSDDGPLMQLAYEVRKAYEKQRQVIAPPEGYEEIGTRFGTRLLWPVLLLQHRLLRVSLGYLDHSKKHQAATFALEAAIESALLDAFPAQAQALTDQWQRIDPAHPGVVPLLNSRGALFCSWTKAERQKKLGALLYSFVPSYESRYGLWSSVDGDHLIAPDELQRWEGAEWPDPRW